MTHILFIRITLHLLLLAHNSYESHFDTRNYDGCSIRHSVSSPHRTSIKDLMAKTNDQSDAD